MRMRTWPTQQEQNDLLLVPREELLAGGGKVGVERRGGASVITPTCLLPNPASIHHTITPSPTHLVVLLVGPGGEEEGEGGADRADNGEDAAVVDAEGLSILGSMDVGME